MPVKMLNEEVMAREKRDLLEVLKLELEFLKNGGYRRPSSWRPQLFFEDSPTCLNYGKHEHIRPCRECVMMQLVPEEHRRENVPCRYIPITEHEETIQSLYATGTPEEIEARLAEWLMSMIERLELERAAKQASGADGSLKSGVGRA
jgi:uncharacterized small protein (DUF1192 family)